MKVLVPFAEGFEEIEATSIVDVLRRAMMDVVTVSITGNREVKGSHGMVITTDALMESVNSSDFNSIALPGGMPGSSNLRENEGVIQAVREIHERNKLVAALCAAPIVLARAGVISGKKVTCYPGFVEELGDAHYTGEPVEQDETIITGRGPGCAIPFALKIVELADGPDTAANLRDSMQVYWM